MDMDESAIIRDLALAERNLESLRDWMLRNQVLLPGGSGISILNRAIDMMSVAGFMITELAPYDAEGIIRDYDREASERERSVEPIRPAN